LNRAEFITRLAAKGYTKKDAEQVMNDMIRTIMEAMVDGESISFHGFGTFSVNDVAEREMVDMQSKERIVIPGHKSPKFAAGKLLKRAIKEGVLRE